MRILFTARARVIATVAGAAGLLAAGALGSLTPASAQSQETTANSPAHQGAQVCGSNNCVYAYIDATAGADTASASATVKVIDHPSPVARLQVDDLSIYTFYSTVAKAGPRNLGNTEPVTQTIATPIQGAACTVYQARAHVSARLSNGALITGQITSLPFTSAAGVCPQLPDSAALNNAPCPDFAMSATCPQVGLRAVLSPDRSRVYAVGSIQAQGAQGGALRTSINAIRTVLDDGSAGASVQGSPNSGTLPDNQAVRISARTYGLVAVTGCHIYRSAMDYGYRKTDGSLVAATLYASTRICS